MNQSRTTARHLVCSLATSSAQRPLLLLLLLFLLLLP
jgi:hypothetical protein